MKQYTPFGPFCDSNAQYFIEAMREGTTAVRASILGHIKAEFGG